jgi:hypothetical protein
LASSFQIITVAIGNRKSLLHDEGRYNMLVVGSDGSGYHRNLIATKSPLHRFLAFVAVEQCRRLVALSSTFCVSNNQHLLPIAIGARSLQWNNNPGLNSSTLQMDLSHIRSKTITRHLTFHPLPIADQHTALMTSPPFQRHTPSQEAKATFLLLTPLPMMFSHQRFHRR